MTGSMVLPTLLNRGSGLHGHCLGTGEKQASSMLLFILMFGSGFFRFSGTLRNTTPKSGEMRFFIQSLLVVEPLRLFLPELCNFPLEHAVYSRQIVVPNVGEQDGVHSVQVSDELPKAGFSFWSLR